MGISIIHIPNVRKPRETRNVNIPELPLWARQISDSQTLHAAESIHYIAKAQRLLICNCIESKYIVHYILNLDLKHLPFVLVYPLGKDKR